MVSTQIINAVRNYTDDALRAVKNAKNGHTDVLDIGGQIHTYFKNSKGSLRIIQDKADDFYNTRLALNSGDSFERYVTCRNGSFVQNANINGAEIPLENLSAEFAEGIFKGLLKKLLG